MKKSIKLTAVTAVAALTLGAGATAFAKDIQGGPMNGPKGGMHKGGPMGGPHDDRDDDGDFGKGPRGAIDGVAAVLAELVKAGTITQAQSDAISKALVNAPAAAKAAAEAQRAAHEKLIADTVGLAWADIQTRLTAGETLAAIAGAKKDALIAALVKEATDRIAADVAADLISQAEHDVIAAAVLVTTSTQLATDVEVELEKRVAATKHSDRIRTALTGIQSAIVLVDSVEQGLDVVNAYAAEHLEIQTKNASRDAAQIRNAGAVFIGRFSPVSLGDYSAGSNHVLPTGGCACHSSGLSVQTFLRGLHFIEYDQKAFTDILDTVVTLANSEDLPAHGEAMTARLENL